MLPDVPAAAEFVPGYEAKVIDESGREVVPGTVGHITTELFARTAGIELTKIPYKGKNKPESQNDANKAHARLRSPGERANAQLKTWRILRKLRCCPWRAGQLAKAIHVLQLREA